MQRCLLALASLAFAFSSACRSTGSGTPAGASTVKDGDSNADANFVAKMGDAKGMLVRVPAGEDVSTSSSREVRMAPTDLSSIGDAAGASAAFDAGFNTAGFGEVEKKENQGSDSSTAWVYSYYTYTWYYTYTYTWYYTYNNYYYYYYPVCTWCYY